MEIFSENKNPFLFPEVLDEIFKLLGVRDLKNCRLVCALWNNLVLKSKSWERSALISVKVGSQTKRTLEDFVAVLERRGWNCFSKNLSIQQCFPIFKGFWLICGTSIKALRLTFVKFETVNDFQTTIYKACPNLEELFLDRVAVDTSGVEEDLLKPIEWLEPQFGEHLKLKSLSVSVDRQGLGVSWMELLSHFPKLEAFHLDSAFFNLAELANSFSILRHRDSTKWKLKQVTFQTYYNNPFPSILHILRDTGLKLETISLSHNCEEKLLREILELHAPSLKKLSLKGGVSISFEANPCRIFPLCNHQEGLEALHELEVINRAFDSLTILKFTPNLKKLIIRDFKSDIVTNTKLSDMEGVSVENCEELILNFKLSCSLEDLRKLITWLPNVTHLEIYGLSNALLQQVCEGWPGLVTLVSKCATVDDAGITGFDEEDVRRINGSEENCPWRPITVQRANLTALEKLRSLQMNGYVRYSLAVAGYCAAYFGIEQMPKLDRLHLGNYRLIGKIWERLHSRYPELEELPS